jgi:hypothetical protein
MAVLRLAANMAAAFEMRSSVGWWRLIQRGVVFTIPNAKGVSVIIRLIELGR